MLSVLPGVVFLLTPGGQRSVPGDEYFLGILGNDTTLFGIQVSNNVFVSLVVFVLLSSDFRSTQLLYHILGIDSSYSAAKRPIIGIDKIKLCDFVLVSVLAAFAGVLNITFYGSTFSATVQGLELIVIAAVSIDKVVYSR